MVTLPSYNHDQTVAYLTCFYEFLALSGYVEYTDILYPPSTGWPEAQINSTALRIIGRNDTVIRLLQHLSYLNKDVEILPDTKPVKYLNFKWPEDLESKVAKGRAEGNLARATDLYEMLPYDDDIELGMVVLTGGKDGKEWLIDTTKGCIYVVGTHSEVQRKETDPRWLAYKRRPIGQYFDEIHDLFATLKYIPMPAIVYKRKRGREFYLNHEIFGGLQEAVLGVQDVFWENGWPRSIYRRERCRKAADLCRMKAYGRWYIRWMQDDVRRATASEREEAMEEARRRLEEAKAEYAEEGWE